MATTHLKGNEVSTSGDLPVVGDLAPSFTLTATDLSDLNSKDFAGRRIVLNIFPSLDTAVCAASVRRFNELAAKLWGTVVICASADLPFAQKRFCGAEGIDNLITGSAFRSSFGEDYGVTLITGPLRGLLARSIIIIDENGKVIYTQLVPEIGQEPDYDAAVAALN